MAIFFERKMDWKEDFKILIDRMVDRRDSEPFRKPVDWEGLGLLDYLTVIRHPMDFQTIQKNLKKSSYLRKEECIRDVRLIWSNAMAYNKVFRTKTFFIVPSTDGKQTLQHCSESLRLFRGKY
jgi:hypothetical protein